MVKTDGVTKKRKKKQTTKTAGAAAKRAISLRRAPARGRRLDPKKETSAAPVVPAARPVPISRLPRGRGPNG